MNNKISLSTLLFNIISQFLGLKRAFYQLKTRVSRHLLSTYSSYFLASQNLPFNPLLAQHHKGLHIIQLNLTSDYERPELCNLIKIKVEINLLIT